MIYQGAYRCKLCGKIFFEGDIYDDNKIDLPEMSEVENFAWHFCDDGNYGEGEAIGLMKREDIYYDEIKWYE